ncbi:MAG: CvpA family protein [Clostridiales bacterium]|nr:CvpA family protein [Clostridiales bacterium]
MNTVLPLLLDLVILGLLVYWCVMGFRRGLILSLCSLLAVVVALAGGWYLANHAYEPLAERLEPIILPVVNERADEAISSEASGLVPSEETASDQAATNQSSSGPLSILSGSLQNQVGQQLENFKNNAVQQLAASIAQTVAKAVLFLVGFLVVLLVWNILFHALHLVAKLPGLHLLNKVLGGAFGLVKGILLLMVAQWLLCDLLGWIPSEVAQQSHLLSLLSALSLSSWL